MALVRGSVNVFNALGIRRLSYIPEHFAKMTINSYRIHEIDQWVYQNLDSRYAITKGLRLNNDNKLVEVQELGVEDSKELTMLSLSCPFLDRNI
jgi:hypothetical protein